MRTLFAASFGGAALLALMQLPAQAQNVARVGAVVRVVKTAKAGSTRFSAAKVGTQLASGARVRTGGRSRALLRYADKSVLKMDELTEVVVTGQRHRQARVVRGRVYGDFRGQATITGGYAVAAVRGTKVVYATDPKTKETYIRCYSGSVYVSSSKNPLRTGTATQVLPTELADPALTETTEDWRGATVRILDGPFKGQESRVTAVDNETGRITYSPALQSGECGTSEGTGYLLSKDPKAKIVILTRNQGTTVDQTGDLRNAYSVAPEHYSGVNPKPWHTAVKAGMTQRSYAGSRDHTNVQNTDFGQSDAVRQTARLRADQTGDLVVVIPPNRKSRFRARAATLSRRYARSFSAAQDDVSTPADTLEQLYLPRGGFGDPEGDQHLFIIEPFAIAGDEGSAVGVRLRNRWVHGSLFGEIGWRYGNFRGDHQQDITEGQLIIKGNVADLSLGRQHMFLGPANNNDLGSLVGFNTVDAAVVEREFGGGYQQRFGYIFDTQALRQRGFSAVFTRGEGLVGQGRWGYSVLAGGGASRGVGGSADLSHPVIQNVFDVYVEGGTTVAGHRLVTGGLYFPGLFQSLGIDVFAEYHARHRQEKASLRLRRDLGGGVQFIAFLDQNLRGGTAVGGAVIYGYQFH